MLKVFLSLLVIFCQLSADYYEKTLDHSTPLGSYQKQEIEIVKDKQTRKEIEKTQQSRLIKKGYSSYQAKNFSKTGVIAEDQYWLWVRDAVLFPTGQVGTYDRLLLKSSENLIPGAAALAVTENNEIAVIICFRHATRSWEVELPRGARNKGEPIEQTAIRELREETGIIVKKTHFLGNMTPDSGLLSSVVPIFFMEVDYQSTPTVELSEAIHKVAFIKKEQLFKAFENGYLDYKGSRIPLRDSFLSFALLQAKLKGFL